MNLTHRIGSTRSVPTYYVDSVNGSDNNVGTAPGTAFATIGAAAATNLLLYSETIDNAVWATGNATVATGAADPNGGTGGYRITVSNSSHNVRQALAVLPSTVYTFSWYVKNNSGTVAKYSIRDNTNSADITAATSYFSSINGSTWTRMSVTFTTPSTCRNVIVYLVRDSGTGLDLLVWGAQLARGTSAKAYVASGANPGTALTKGSRLMLAKGSTWREQATILNENVRVAAFGSGARPILDASESVLAATWTATAGQANVYQITVSIDSQTSGTRVNVWENDAYLTRQTSLANCQANASSYNVTAEFGSVTVYVHLAADADPRSKADGWITYTKRFAGIYTVADHVDVSGIEVKKSHGTAVCWLGTNARISDVISRQGSRHNFFASGGCMLTDCQAIDAYNPIDGMTAYVVYMDDPTGKTATLTNCTASNSFGTRQGTAFLSHSASASGAGNCFDSISYINCTASNYSAGIASNNDLITNITNCTITNVGTTITPVIGTWNITGGSFDSTVLGLSSGTGITVNMSGITFLNAAAAVCPIVISAAGNALSLTDSSISCGAQACVQISGSGTTATLLRNTYIDATAFYVANFPANGTGITSDHNDYTGTQAQRFNVNGSTKTLAQWRTLSGQDTNSTP